MALLQQWRDMAYDQQADKAKLQQFWAIYFTKEKDIYAELLKNPDELVRGTVKELAEKFGVDIMTMTGFLDGINDSLKAPNPIEEMEEEAASKEKELYDLKHELIASQIKLDNTEKSLRTLQQDQQESSRQIVRLETEIRGMKDKK